MTRPAGTGAMAVRELMIEQPKWRQGLRPLVVALALLALVSWVLLALFQGPQGLSPVELAKILTAGGELESALEPEGYEPRSGAGEGIVTNADPAAELAFLLGVQTLDLEIALRSQRFMAAGSLARRVADALDVAGFSNLAVEYRKLSGRLDPPAGGRARAEASRLSRRLAELAAEDPALDALALTFGWWCEAGRLAGRSGKTQLLTSVAFRQFLTQLEARGDWHPKVAIEIARLTDLLQPELNDLQVAAVTVSLEAILACARGVAASRSGSVARVHRGRRTR